MVRFPLLAAAPQDGDLPAKAAPCHDALIVIENWNSANSFIFSGKSGEIATNRLDEQEIAILCLHLLQISLVYVNTLMIQEALGDHQWRQPLTPSDLRSLSPLIYLHVYPCGRFSLDMSERLPGLPQRDRHLSHGSA